MTLAVDMDVLLLLPAEISLQVFSHLYVDDLLNLRLVSRFWRDFFDLHESTIFHCASALHNIIQSHQIHLSDLNAICSERSLIGVEGWKAFFQRRMEIEKSWSGKGLSRLRELSSTGETVHRLKVDESAGLVITTHREGGLRVTDLWRDEVLWSLSKEYVREHAHVEYDNGFIVFDRLFGSKEVWRRAYDYDPDNLPSVSQPDGFQIRASDIASTDHDSSNTRGHFKPWALLESPEPTRAYRFVYPTLVVAGFKNVYLWDIPTAQLVQTIPEIQAMAGGDALGDINYVELSSRHVFICGSEQFRIFSRADGKLLLHIAHSQEISGESWSMRLDVPYSSQGRMSGDDVLPGSILTRQYATFSPPQSDLASRDELRQSFEFVGAHVSSCGRHLSILRHSRWMLVVRDFERILRGEAGLSDSAILIYIGSVPYRTKYLAVTGNRVAVALGCGLFTINLDTYFPTTKIEDTPGLSNPIYPHISAALASHLHDYDQLSYLTCLQMTETALYFTRSPHPFEDDLETVDGLPVSTVFCIEVGPEVNGADGGFSRQ